MSDTITVPSPYKGLTLRLGDVEINVHQVDNGVVYYGKYELGEDWPARMYMMPVDDFMNSAGRSIIDGAVAYSRIA